MKFGEKLGRLIEYRRRTRADVAREAGLNATALGSYINRNSEPLMSKGLKLAEVLNVPAAWLGNDDFDWPPPEPGDQVTVLREGLGKEMRPTALAILEAIQEARMVDWVAVAEALLKCDRSKALPPLAREAADAIKRITDLHGQLREFEPAALIGEDAPPGVVEEWGSDSSAPLRDLSWALDSLKHELLAYDDVSSLLILRQLTFDVPTIRERAANNLPRLKRQRAENLQREMAWTPADGDSVGRGIDAMGRNFTRYLASKFHPGIYAHSGDDPTQEPIAKPRRRITKPKK